MAQAVGLARAWRMRAHVHTPHARSQSHEVSDVAHEGKLSGWLLKTTSKLGPTAARGPPLTSLMDKRFFVLRGSYLQWYGTEDEAKLRTSARNEIDLRSYTAETVVGFGGELLIALAPRRGSTARKSWCPRPTYAPPCLAHVTAFAREGRRAPQALCIDVQLSVP